MSLDESRIDYGMAALDEQSVDPDPIEQFRRWLHEAEGAGVPEPNAMTLATATSDGLPSARIVLLRGLDRAGFVFFTDYRSRKGRELTANSRAALVFLPAGFRTPSPMPISGADLEEARSGPGARSKVS
jgi:pyridoxamine 5'-phosphate oxidase